MLAAITIILTHRLLTNVFHRHMASTAGSNHRKNIVSETGEQTECWVTGHRGRQRGARKSVQLRAVVFGCLTQQAQIPAHVVSCWCAPTFWVPAINKGMIKKMVAAQSARALH